MSTTYLSPEYFAFFKQFALEAKKRDMKLWIVDDIGYPSGFAAGRFANDKLRMKALSIGKRIPVKGGETISQNVTRQRPIVGKNHVIFDHAIVSNMAVGQKIPAVTDPRDRSNPRRTIYRHEFPETIVLANLEIGRFAGVF